MRFMGRNIYLGFLVWIPLFLSFAVRFCVSSSLPLSLSFFLFLLVFFTFPVVFLFSVNVSFVTGLDCAYEHGSTKHSNSKRPHRRNPQVPPPPASPSPSPLFTSNQLMKGTWQNTGTNSSRKVTKTPLRNTKENLSSHRTRRTEYRSRMQRLA